MVAKLGFAAATLSLLALASGAFLSSVPTYKVDSSVVGGIISSLTALSSGSLSPKELEAMEQSILELVTKGDDAATQLAVKQLSSFVSNVLIPSRMRALKNSQRRLDSKFRTLQQCALDEKIKIDAEFHEQYDTAKDHKADYLNSRAKQADCNSVLEAKALVKDAYCSSVDEMNACHCHSKMVKAFGERNRDCKNAPPIDPSHEKCCDAFYDHEMHFNECNIAHLDAAYAEKQHGILMSKMCRNYDMCYDIQLKEYQAAEKLVREKDAHQSWDVIFRMQCLIESFKKGKVSKAQAQACKDKQQDAPSVSYPTVPAKEPCRMPVHA